MKISALRFFNVKRFAGRGIAIEGISEGVNVLCAVNEFGKSTSFEALHALFFQPHSSTAADVRSLRPYSGGNPLVEADIATEAGRFRITKQFFGGRSARVVDLANERIVAQADEAENFIAGLVRDGTAGPAGLLWVRQGITGIEKRSRSEEDSEKQVRASLLESVQGEVEAVTGGRRMAEIMAATEEALGRLVTSTGRPKAGERFAAAVDELNRLDADERRLDSEVMALRGALDKRASSAKRLAEIDRAEDRDERRKEIEAAQAAFDAAKSQAEALRAAEAELRLAREQRDSADRDLKSFRDALQKAEVLRGRLAEAERLSAQALARRDAAATAAAKAFADSEAAETEEQEARALLARLDAALKAREAAERLAELQQRLEAAEVARKELEEGQASLALLRLPEGAVAELEALDVDIAKLRAVAEAGRPSVAIAYEPQAPAVRLDGTPLKDGEPRGYDGHAQLSIPGIGIVTLRSNRSAGNDDRLRQAEERRRIQLASMGVEDLAAARKREVEAQRKESDLRELKARLSLLAPDGLPKLREEAAARREAAGDVLELKEDPAQVRKAHEQTEARRQAARQATREAEPIQAGAADAVVAAQIALAKLEAERTQMEAVLGPENTRTERERQLADRLAGLDTRLAEQQAAVEGFRGEAADLASAEATVRRVKSVAEAAEKEIGRLREEIAGLTAEIRARSEDAVEEKWRETVDALTAAKARAAAYEKEVAVLQRLRTALETARSHAREIYLLPVMTELRPLLGLLFEDVSITFDEKTLLPHKIMRNGQEEEVERLSGGMREQLSVLTRLAFARLLAKDGRPAPVILDDALVYSDDDRIEKMFDALHRQAREQQIIVFSCRQRAFQRLGGNVLQLAEWVPG
ncbi:DNA-binding protein [Pseudaminobacter sp. 19-2017]|uniref:DNA-binding protein n=1 Tax=Pseudaminobacter soli (ex Zhang et al. 2022) TaxID=2831468 RepID=A0A942I1E6_9HYPH|nr:DNA-binding protein [Pseudaminobacter soli]MBS3647837.1 DNA-binding protein [Pseudaminobacter soli]